MVNILIASTFAIYLALRAAGCGDLPLLVTIASPDEFVFFSAGFWAAATIFGVSLHRFDSEVDFKGAANTPKPTRGSVVRSAILHNTMEQAFLFVCVSLLLLHTDRDSYSGPVRLNSVLFFLARILFCTSYTEEFNIARGLGFSFCQAPQALSLVLWLIAKATGRVLL